MSSGRQHTAWFRCVNKSSLKRRCGIELGEGELAPVSNQGGCRPRDGRSRAHIGRIQNPSVQRFVISRIYMRNILTVNSARGSSFQRGFVLDALLQLSWVSWAGPFNLSRIYMRSILSEASVR